MLASKRFDARTQLLSERESSKKGPEIGTYGPDVPESVAIIGNHQHQPGAIVHGRYCPSRKRVKASKRWIQTLISPSGPHLAEPRSCRTSNQGSAKVIVPDSSSTIGTLKRPASLGWSGREEDPDRSGQEKIMRTACFAGRDQPLILENISWPDPFCTFAFPEF